MKKMPIFLFIASFLSGLILITGCSQTEDPSFPTYAGEQSLLKSGDDDDDDDFRFKVKGRLRLKQNGNDVVVKVRASGLLPNTNYTVRPYISTVTNCMRGVGNALAAFNVTSNSKGRFKIQEKVTGKVVDDVGSVSIRRTGTPPANPPVVCFEDVTP